MFTKPDNTKNKAGLLNLVASHKLSDTLTLSGNAYYRHIRTNTFNGDINDDSLGENVYLAAASSAAGTRDRTALTNAGYTGMPTAAETLATTPFPSFACIANILQNLEPNEKCNGLANRTGTTQHDEGLSGQAAWNTPIGGMQNLLTLGASLLGSRAHFLQSSQFGYLTPDRGIVTVPGPAPSPMARRIRKTRLIHASTSPARPRPTACTSATRCSSRPSCSSRCRADTITPRWTAMTASRPRMKTAR